MSFNKTSSLILSIATLTSSVVFADALPAACSGVALSKNPIHVVLPAQAGNSSDAGARTLLASATKKFGLPFVIENKPGVSGNLGMVAAREAANRDKNNVLLFSQAPEMTLNPKLTEPKANHQTGDFKAVTYVAAMSYVLLCHTSDRLPKEALTNVDSLVEHIRKNKLSLNMADGGASNTTGLATIKLGQATKLAVGNKDGLPFFRVPFKGTTEAMTAVMGGQVDCMFQSTAGADGILKSQKDAKNKVIAVGITSANDSKEYGLTSIQKSLHASKFGEVKNWMGLFAGQGMEEKYVNCYNEIFQIALKDQDVVTSFKAKGFANESTDPKSPKDFARFVTDEVKRMEPMAVAVNQLNAGTDITASTAIAPTVKEGTKH